VSGTTCATVITVVFVILNKQILNVYKPPIFLSAVFGGYLCTLIRENIKPANNINPEINRIIKSAIIYSGWGILYALIHSTINPKIYYNGYYNFVKDVLILAIVGGISGGIRIQKKVVNTQKALPNQGIRRSVKYALVSFAVLAPTAALVGWVTDSVRNPFYLTCLGVAVGLMSALGINEGSGIVSIQHLILRVVLWYKGDIPWNYARFLNYATERIFLQDIGNSYTFIHRMLLEHFTQINLKKVKKGS
ncbi:MAG: hypothetical protein PUP93_21400, partial [Rhizonema sp. NSF051]|nr:hypothetical protein [Rhizonema sp. NSF051]